MRITYVIQIIYPILCHFQFEEDTFIERILSKILWQFILNIIYYHNRKHY